MKGNTLTGKFHLSNTAARPLYTNVLRERERDYRTITDSVYVCTYVCMWGSYVAAPARLAGSSSHQYQSPALLNTPINKATSIPL